MLEQVNSAVFYLRIKIILDNWIEYSNFSFHPFNIWNYHNEKAVNELLWFNLDFMYSSFKWLLWRTYMFIIIHNKHSSAFSLQKKLKKNPLIEVKWQRHNKVLFCNRSMSEYIRTLNAFDIGLDFGFYFTYFAFACDFDVCS